MSKVAFLALKEIQTLVDEASVSLVLQHLLENLTKRVVAFCFHCYCLRCLVYQKTKQHLSHIYLGLERNETAPEPVLPEPRAPSKNEREEAVQFSISSESDVSC